MGSKVNFDFLLRGLSVALAACSGLAALVFEFGQQMPSLPGPPKASSVLEWLFLAVVVFVLWSAIWMVRFVLTKGLELFKSQQDMVKELTRVLKEIAREVDELGSKNERIR